MAWRVIVRFSLDKDTKSRVRNSGVAPILTAAGLTQRLVGGKKTATWEGPATSEASAARELGKLFKLLANPTTVVGADPKVRLDHIWLYVEKA